MFPVLSSSPLWFVDGQTDGWAVLRVRTPTAEPKPNPPPSLRPFCPHLPLAGAAVSRVRGLGNSCGADTVVKFKKGDAGVRVRVAT